ncbi:MAG TPA: 5-dehydro-4-deoxy-D-glucuronate isomerase [Vicinamibacteria bacterium]|nr:5-dehydro-4-deoxy-D-glucuronate isomerase [Vicinamibacteria bacterium]
MENRPFVDFERYRRMTTDELRAAFLVEGLFALDEVRLVHWEAERTIIGSAVPRERPLRLEAPDEVRAASFLARREIGIVNVGGPGAVRVGDTRHELDNRDILYAGRGAGDLVFESRREDSPAAFWLVSHGAHAAHPTRLVRREEARTKTIGAAANASARVLRQYVHAEAVPTCQLVMGITDLEPGSVWNTCPPHTHSRRTEIYLYFDLDPGAVVLHVMGPPEETRHLVVRERQAVLSPPWSMHFGAATSRYGFVWSMGGENQDFDDMDQVPLDRLR